MTDTTVHAVDGRLLKKYQEICLAHNIDCFGGGADLPGEGITVRGVASAVRCLESDWPNPRSVLELACVADCSIGAALVAAIAAGLDLTMQRGPLVR